MAGPAATCLRRAGALRGLEPGRDAASARSCARIRGQTCGRADARNHPLRSRALDAARASTAEQPLLATSRRARGLCAVARALSKQWAAAWCDRSPLFARIRCKRFRFGGIRKSIAKLRHIRDFGLAIALLALDAHA